MGKHITVVFSSNDLGKLRKSYRLWAAVRPPGKQVYIRTMPGAMPAIVTAREPVTSLDLINQARFLTWEEFTSGNGGRTP